MAHYKNGREVQIGDVIRDVFTGRQGRITIVAEEACYAAADMVDGEVLAAPTQEFELVEAV